MTGPNFGGQPNQGQPQFGSGGGWTPPAPQQFQPQMPQQQQAPQQPQYQQAPTHFVQAEPHVQMPAPYFPPPQQPQAIDPRAPQYAPAWQGGGQLPPQFAPQQPQQPQRQFPQQPQSQQQSQGQFQPAPAQQIQFDNQGRMFGPGVPQELQGRTMQEATQMYGMMQRAVQQPQRQAPQQQQQQPLVPPTQQVQGQARATSPWTDPEGFFGRLLDEKLGAMLGPVVQQNNEEAIVSVRDRIQAQYPIYKQYEQQVLARLEGLPVETLKNPQAWELALSSVVGEAQLRGGQQHQQPFQQQQQPTLPWQPAVQPQSFFTESPSAVMQGGYDPSGQMQQQGQFGQPQLSAAQQEVARRFGMSNAQYAQGMGMR